MNESLLQVVLVAALWFGYLASRFGGWNAAAFFVLNGVFCGICDGLVYFGLRPYQYPGQSPLWVVGYITFGWFGMACLCFFLADGMLGGQLDKWAESTKRNLLWQLPLLSASTAVLLDLMIDPLAGLTGRWVWTFHGSHPFQGVPLGNFIAWFLFMGKGALSWLILMGLKRSPFERFKLSLISLPVNIVGFWSIFIALCWLLEEIP